ncbi:hypothetical protein ACOMHN_048695 [Nucella lapillus]
MTELRSRPQEPVDRPAQNDSLSKDPIRPDTAPETATTTQPETTARAHRVHTRTTLQPSVQDFNGKIINRTLGGDTDEDQILWTVVGAGGGGGNRLHLKLPLFKQTADDQTDPSPQTPNLPPATFRWTSSPINLLIDTTRIPLAPTVVKTERVAAWTEDVHRRHVTRTARARARLMPAKPWATERVVPSGHSMGGGGGGVGVDSGGGLEPSFQLSASPEVVDGGGGVQESGRSCGVKPSKSSPKKDYGGRGGALTSRSRPATTTGRYFDRGNGLRSSRSAHVARTRPKTAGHWSWSSPGLSIQKVVLRPKELL